MKDGGTTADGARRARFEAVALPMLKALYNAALRLTRDPSAAEDVLQEAYLRAYRTFDGFAEGTNAKAWLFKIVHTVFVNRYHRERRQPDSIPPEEVDAAFARGAARDGTAPPRGDVTSQEVDAALQRLPLEFRSAVELVDLQDLSYEEAAATLGCKLGTLRSRLFRGRKLLFVQLEVYARDLGYRTGSGRTK